MQRMTRQRAAVVDLLAGTDDFRSAQQLHEMLRDQGETIGLATVYRTMQSLAEHGEVDVLRADDGETLYRQCATPTHHHHLVCRYCGATVELDAQTVERWAHQMGAEYGYSDVQHTVELFGTCSDCAARETQATNGR